MCANLSSFTAYYRTMMSALACFVVSVMLSSICPSLSGRVCVPMLSLYCWNFRLPLRTQKRLNGIQYTKTGQYKKKAGDRAKKLKRAREREGKKSVCTKSRQVGKASKIICCTARAILLSCLGMTKSDLEMGMYKVNWQTRPLTSL